MLKCTNLQQKLIKGLCERDRFHEKNFKPIQKPVVQKLH